MTQHAHSGLAFMANRAALTAVFALSFASYLAPDLTLGAQLVPLGLFTAIVIIKVFLSKDLLPSMESLFATDGLFFVLFLSTLVITASVESKVERSFAFSLVLSCCLILARLYMAVVAVSEVLEAFFWSGVISVAVFLPLAFATLLESVRTLSRFTAFSFHPNLLAFVLAGYFCAMVWKVLTARWLIKLIAAPVGVICLVIIFFASSRGAIVGIVAGCSASAWLSIGRLSKEQKTKAVMRTIVGVGVLSVIGLTLQHIDLLSDGIAAADTVLAVTDPNRGMDSGFTGRLDKWEATMHELSGGEWLIGRGIRSSDVQDQLIDNSYLVMLYELGIVPLLLVVWRYADILRHYVKAYHGSDNAVERRLYLLCVLFTVVFVTSNVFARFLLSVGNPFSLCAVLIFVSPMLPAGKILPFSPVPLLSRKM